MPKREFLHEWMHRFDLYAPKRVVRVWAGATPGFNDMERRQQWDDLINALAEAQHEHKDPAETVAKISFVNAVEVLDAAGNGRLVYVDWP